MHRNAKKQLSNIEPKVDYITDEQQQDIEDLKTSLSSLGQEINPIWLGLILLTHYPMRFYVRYAQDDAGVLLNLNSITTPTDKFRTDVPVGTFNEEINGYNPLWFINNNEPVRNLIFASKGDFQSQRLITLFENDIQNFYTDECVPREYAFARLGEDNSENAQGFSASLLEFVKANLRAEYLKRDKSPLTAAQAEDFLKEIKYVEYVKLYLRYLFNKNHLKHVKYAMNYFHEKMADTSGELRKLIYIIALPVLSYFIALKWVNYVRPYGPFVAKDILDLPKGKKTTKEEAAEYIKNGVAAHNTRKMLVIAARVVECGLVIGSVWAFSQGTFSYAVAGGLAAIPAVLSIGKRLFGNDVVAKKDAQKKKEEQEKLASIAREKELQKQNMVAVLKVLANSFKFESKEHDGAYRLVFKKEDNQHRRIFLALLFSTAIECRAYSGGMVDIELSDTAIEILRGFASLDEKIVVKLVSQVSEFDKVTVQMRELFANYPFLHEKKETFKNDGKISYESYYEIRVNISGIQQKSLAALFKDKIVSQDENKLVFKWDKSLTPEQKIEIDEIFHSYFSTKPISPIIDRRYSPHVSKQTSPFLARRKAAMEALTSAPVKKSKTEDSSSSSSTGTTATANSSAKIIKEIADAPVIKFAKGAYDFSDDAEESGIYPVEDGHGIYFVTLINFPENEKDGTLFRILHELVAVDPRFARAKGQDGIKELKYKIATRNTDKENVTAPYELKVLNKQFGNFRIPGYVEPSTTGRERLIVFDYKNHLKK